MKSGLCAQRRRHRRDDCRTREFLAGRFREIEGGFPRCRDVAAVYAGARRDRIHLPARIFGFKIRIADDLCRKMGSDGGYSGFNHEASARSPLLAITSASLTGSPWPG